VRCLSIPSVICRGVPFDGGPPFLFFCFRLPITTVPPFPLSLRFSRCPTGFPAGVHWSKRGTVFTPHSLGSPFSPSSRHLFCLTNAVPLFVPSGNSFFLFDPRGFSPVSLAFFPFRSSRLTSILSNLWPRPFSTDRPSPGFCVLFQFLLCSPPPPRF